MPDSLQEAGVLSQYKSDDQKLHQQERDVAKYWMKNHIRIALYGLENQTAVAREMSLRVIGYDGDPTASSC